MVEMLKKNIWLVLAMFLALHALYGCAQKNVDVMRGDTLKTECPFIEPVLDFGKATIKDVRYKEGRTLFADKSDDNALITSTDRYSIPWTAYVFNEEKETLDFCVVTLEKSRLAEVVEYLNNRYGKAQKEIDGMKVYLDKEHDCSILLAPEMKYKGSIGIAYVPNDRFDELYEKL